MGIFCAMQRAEIDYLLERNQTLLELVKMNENHPNQPNSKINDGLLLELQENLQRLDSLKREEILELRILGKKKKKNKDKKKDKKNKDKKKDKNKEEKERKEVSGSSVPPC